MPIPSLFLSDDRLLAECRLDRYRGSGPGGQKRNKTSNAVRITHLPSGLVVTATESRSLAENRLYALRRIRLKLAVELREPVDLLHFQPPDWLLSLRHNAHLEVSHRHALYAATAALLLDLMHALDGNPAAVAVNLGVSTTTVVKLMENEPVLWTRANEIRAESGMKPLTHHK